MLNSIHILTIGTSFIYLYLLLCQNLLYRSSTVLLMHHVKTVLALMACTTGLLIFLDNTVARGDHLTVK